MRYLRAIAFLFTALTSFSQNNTIAIIPEPVSIVQQQGLFYLKR
ncbi:hypothetical protein [Agriterribacter sp.]|nr:hypothetical protein [Agriterribacter sp.]HTN08065.1 hypothetical protein [Agriterribacter sp.]